MKKITVLLLFLTVILMVSGCRLQIIPPSLSFNSYQIPEEEIIKEDESIVYEYEVSAQIDVEGSLDGMYFVEIYGDGSKLNTYGPVNINSETMTIENIKINSDEGYSKITLKLYIWKNDLQQIVSKNF